MVNLKENYNQKMVINKSKKSEFVKYIFFTLFIILFSASVLVFPNVANQGIKNGIYCCINTLIPSFFPFMLLSSMIINSGISKKLEKIFSFVTKYLFNLPGYTAPIIILSLIGGYPIGAVSIRQMYKNKEINSEQLIRMMNFCINAGPAFIIGMVGGTLIGDTNVGVILFAVQIVSSLLLGIVCGMFSRIKKTKTYSKKSEKYPGNKFSFSQILITSCNSVCRSLCGMCSLIVLFFMMINILMQTGILNLISKKLFDFGISENYTISIVMSLLEVTQSCIHISKNHLPYWALSFAIGFGGICVHSQVISELTDTPFKYRVFIVFRLINGLITALLTKLLLKCEIIISAFSNVRNMQIERNLEFNCKSAFLIILCICFTLSCKFENNNS